MCSTKVRKWSRQPPRERQARIERLLELKLRRLFVVVVLVAAGWFPDAYAGDGENIIRG
jgi:hypothetical protein